MDVSPQTLREVEFRGALRGYNPDDVDEFLDRVAAGLEILQERLRQATERAVRAESCVGDLGEGGDSLRNTLVLAQRTADLAIEEAKESAARIVAEAGEQAAAVVADAERAAAVTAEEAQRQLRAELAELGHARDALRADVAALEAHLESERVRVREALSEVLQRVDTHAARASDPPPDTPVTIPPPRAVPEPSTPGDVADGGGDGLDWDVDDVVLEEEPVVDAAVAEAEFDSDDAWAGAGAEDDPFLAELRRAVHDTEPLGPRDEADVVNGNGDGFYDQQAEPRRFGSRLRRRK